MTLHNVSFGRAALELAIAQGKALMAQEERDICPDCGGNLVGGGIKVEFVGECHGTPAWQNVATKKVCQDCDYEEAI